MLQERNIYTKPDLVYKERQRALRVLEHKIEGRPFEPRSGVDDELEAIMGSIVKRFSIGREWQQFRIPDAATR